MKINSILALLFFILYLAPIKSQIIYSFQCLQDICNENYECTDKDHELLEILNTIHLRKPTQELPAIISHISNKIDFINTFFFYLPNQRETLNRYYQSCFTYPIIDRNMLFSYIEKCFHQVNELLNQVMQSGKAECKERCEQFERECFNCLEAQKLILTKNINLLTCKISKQVYRDYHKLTFSAFEFFLDQIPQ